MVIKKVFDTLKSKRALDLDTLQSFVEVNGSYELFVHEIADELGTDIMDTFEVFDVLQTQRLIICYPQDDPYIERIEVNDR